MHLTLDAFAQAHRDLAEGEFLRRITVPHLILRYLANPPQTPGDTFRTVRISSAVTSAARGERLVLPIVKRPFANAFAMMVTVGRAPNNDLVLLDPRVSKLQAYFTNRGGAWQVWDPVSTNGTVLDGTPVPRTCGLTLRSTSVVGFTGAAECLFVLPADLHRLLVSPALSEQR